ncbi:MAG: AraC family transcriptional regulator [Arenibacterium sp.]
MEHFDRLTTLIDRFKLVVRPAAIDAANLIVLKGADGSPKRAQFRTRDLGFLSQKENYLFSAYVNWGGQQNPLLTALPQTLDIDLSEDPESVGLVKVMQSEINLQRCGGDAVLSRLGEVLIVRIIRAQIESGAKEPGLLAGLSDPRLSRSIVAMHDRPGKAWRNDDLAQIAGMSLSRFSELFLSEVGEPPAAYLRRWRLTLARQDIAKGHRVDTVSRRYGFSSPEGFSRAFKKLYGATPIDLRNGRTRPAVTASEQAHGVSG